MSNHLAIATVTEALIGLLYKGIEQVVTGAHVYKERPKDLATHIGSTINVFLYQVKTNAALRNADLPSRSSDGRLMQRPQAAIDLFYLLSFYGNYDNQIPERLLGHAIRTLHDQPLLTRKDINDAKVAQTHLADSDLDQQIEKVKFTPLPLDMDEMSKLWAMFVDTPYVLSVVYKASVVLIESERISQPALPVQEPLLYVVPFHHPVIESITAYGDPGGPIFEGTTLRIRGQRLDGDETVVCIGDEEDKPLPENISDTEILLPVPEGLLAGVHVLRVVHKLFMGGEGGELHRAEESNVMPFVLLPQISSLNLIVDLEELTVGFSPDVGRDQKVLLLLNEKDAAPDRKPYAYTFKAPADNGITDPNVLTTESVTFDLTGISAATYLVRISVDGAISLLDSEKDVTIP